MFQLFEAFGELQSCDLQKSSRSSKNSVAEIVYVTHSFFFSFLQRLLSISLVNSFVKKVLTPFLQGFLDRFKRKLDAQTALEGLQGFDLLDQKFEIEPDFTPDSDSAVTAATTRTLVFLIMMMK